MCFARMSKSVKWRGRLRREIGKGDDKRREKRNLGSRGAISLPQRPVADDVKPEAASRSREIVNESVMSTACRSKRENEVATWH